MCFLNLTRYFITAHSPFSYLFFTWNAIQKLPKGVKKFGNLVFSIANDRKLKKNILTKWVSIII